MPCIVGAPAESASNVDSCLFFRPTHSLIFHRQCGHLTRPHENDKTRPQRPGLTDLGKHALRPLICSPMSEMTVLSRMLRLFQPTISFPPPLFCQSFHSDFSFFCSSLDPLQKAHFGRPPPTVLARYVDTSKQCVPLVRRSPASPTPASMLRFPDANGRCTGGGTYLLSAYHWYLVGSHCNLLCNLRRPENGTWETPKRTERERATEPRDENTWKERPIKRKYGILGANWWVLHRPWVVGSFFLSSFNAGVSFCLFEALSLFLCMSFSASFPEMPCLSFLVSHSDLPKAGLFGARPCLFGSCWSSWLSWSFFVSFSS